MKLTKLSSAVSVSLLAVALTACGGSNEANDPPVKVTTPEVNANTNTDAAKKAEEAKKAQEAAQKAQAAKIAALVAALKEAGLNDANATFVANSNPDLAIGSTDYNALLAAKLAEQKKVDESGNQGAAPTKTTSEVVVKSNPFIKGIDTSKNATVTANQYSRQPGSNFDRRANPSELGGLGEVGIDDPTVQNPYLSNYVLAVEAVNGKVVAIDSTGEYVSTIANNAQDRGERVAAAESPYLKEKGLQYTINTQDGDKGYNYSSNFNQLAAPNQANVAIAKDAPDAQVVKFDESETARVYTLQEVNSDNATVSKDATENAFKVATGKTPVNIARADNGKVTGAPMGKDNESATSGLVVYNAKSIAVGNKDGAKLGYMIPTYGVEENIYDADGNALNAIEALPKGGATTIKNTVGYSAAELVQYKVASTSPNENFYVEKFKASDDDTKVSKVAVANADTAVQGNAQKYEDGGENVANIIALAKPVANTFETRIFGKNFKGYDAGAEGFQINDNTYEARFNSKGGLTNLAPKKLQHVQYGRLTNNIDVLANKTEKDDKVVVYRQFQQHGAPNSVDTYFYRGTNKTTLEQMEAVKAKGGVITYNGHALTYGIGPKVGTEKIALGLPTAYGLKTGESTIGNFVQAKYDIAKSRVDGTVYNFLNSSVKNNPDEVKKADFIKQDLVSFGGDVYGNTVTGTATKLGLGEQGTFTGSFFGKDANELGGSISSIERSKGYAQPKWGAVFGATKGSTVDNFNVIEQQNKTATP